MTHSTRSASARLHRLRATEFVSVILRLCAVRDRVSDIMMVIRYRWGVGFEVHGGVSLEFIL